MSSSSDGTLNPIFEALFGQAIPVIELTDEATAFFNTQPDSNEQEQEQDSCPCGGTCNTKEFSGDGTYYYSFAEIPEAPPAPDTTLYDLAVARLQGVLTYGTSDKQALEAINLLLELGAL